MSEAIRVEIPAFEAADKDIRDVELSLPFGDYSIQIDIADTGIPGRINDIAKVFLRREELAKLNADDLDAAREIVESIDMLKNACDYVYGTKICADIARHIDPLTVVKVDGKPMIVSMVIVTMIQTEVNKLTNAKKLAGVKGFVDKYA